MFLKKPPLLSILPRHHPDDVAVRGGARLRVPAVPEEDRALPLLPAFLRRRLHARRLPPSAVREEPGETDEPGVRPRHLHTWTCHAAWVQQAELHPGCWRWTEPLTGKYRSSEAKMHIHSTRSESCMKTRNNEDRCMKTSYSLPYLKPLTINIICYYCYRL